MVNNHSDSLFRREDISTMSSKKANGDFGFYDIFKFKGSWFFQMKRDKDGKVYTEIEMMKKGGCKKCGGMYQEGGFLLPPIEEL